MVWNVSPEIFSLGPISLRWYGMLFALGFVLAYGYLRKVFKDEGKPAESLDQLLIYVVIGTIAGARLGHCFFYEPMRYLENPMEILFVWHGGLASHGGAIGILTSIYLFSRKHKNFPFLWTTDRVSLTVPLAGACVRLGNFMNSEILGKVTDQPWGIVFSRVDQSPRHPAQLYEAIIYIFVFFILHFVYRQKKSRTPRGLIFGLLFVMLFTARFFVEFVKENQVDFESNLALNMGQVLSIPAVALGLWMIYRAVKKEKL